MTKEEKIGYLDKFYKEFNEYNDGSVYIYICPECKFKIAIFITEDKLPSIECFVNYHFEYDEVEQEYEKTYHIYNSKIKDTYMEAKANNICLSCGSPLKFAKNRVNKTCANCGGKDVVLWKDLANKKCPICDGYFNKTIYYKSKKEYNEAGNINYSTKLLEAEQKYGITSRLSELNRLEPILKKYSNSYYVVKNPNNVIRFKCYRSFHSRFYIIAEWNDSLTDMKLIYCCLEYFSKEHDKYVEKTLTKEMLDNLLQTLNKYKFFTEPNTSDIDGIDGSTWTLEISIGKQYRELSVWSPENGVAYDIGHLLLEYVNPNIRGEIY